MSVPGDVPAGPPDLPGLDGPGELFQRPAVSAEDAARLAELRAADSGFHEEAARLVPVPPVMEG